MLVYIGLLAIIMAGSVFSAYSALLSEEKSQNSAQSLDQKFLDPKL
jgi:hypothetical protein